MPSVVLNSKHHVDREASASSVVKEINYNRREHRKDTENMENKLCVLRGVELKSHVNREASAPSVVKEINYNRREHRKDTENTENKLCVLRGVELKSHVNREASAPSVVENTITAENTEKTQRKQRATLYPL